MIRLINWLINELIDLSIIVGLIYYAKHAGLSLLGSMSMVICYPMVILQEIKKNPVGYLLEIK
jgi:hypothetical protein